LSAFRSDQGQLGFKLGRRVGVLWPCGGLIRRASIAKKAAIARVFPSRPANEAFDYASGGDGAIVRVDDGGPS